MWKIGTSRKDGTGWEEEIFHQPPSTCFHQLLRLLTTWDFAHGNAMMQQTEKRKTQSFNSFLSHSIHTAQLEGHQHIVKHSHFSLCFPDPSASTPPIAGTFEAVEDVSVCTPIHRPHWVQREQKEKARLRHTFIILHTEPFIRGRKCPKMHIASSIIKWDSIQSRFPRNPFDSCD